MELLAKNCTLKLDFFSHTNAKIVSMIEKCTHASAQEQKPHPLFELGANSIMYPHTTMPK